VSAVDLGTSSVRDLNSALHGLPSDTNDRTWTIDNPAGAHAIAVGLDGPLDVTINGHVGYYCAGMNKTANVTVNGHTGWGIAENMMSGTVRVTGNASQAAGATGHGGMLVVEGDAGHRCGISMKGIDIVVAGSIGHFGAFMGQAGNLVVCGDVGENLGDSLYEARIFVRGKVASLGADCVEKDMTDEDRAALKELLARAGVDADPADFRRYGSARKLYHFNVDHADAY
jgi:methylamine---glutamate N-methyltransferase subunit B